MYYTYNNFTDYLLYKVFIAYFYYKDYTNHESNSFPYNKNIKTIEIHNNEKANTKVLHDELNIYIPEGFELITDKAKSNFVMDNCEPYIKGLIDNNNFDAMILVCNTRRAIDIGNIDYHGINNTIFPWMNCSRRAMTSMWRGRTGGRSSIRMRSA